MTIVLTYFFIGLAVLIAVLIENLVRKRKPTDPLITSYLDALHSKRALARKIGEDIFLPLLTGAVIVVGWPFVLIWGTWLVISDARRKSLDNATKFAVTREHLVEKLPIESIEQRERIEDPLSAVPDLPFGHLNAAWMRFVSKLESGSEIWSFRATRRTSKSQEQIIVGYVAVTNEKVGPEFVTEYRDLSDKL